MRGALAIVQFFFIKNNVSETRLCPYPLVKCLLHWDKLIELVPISTTVLIYPLHKLLDLIYLHFSTLHNRF